MIQFNLLPEVKIQYIKTQRLKRLMVLIAIVASAASVLILLMTISFSSIQKHHLSNLDKDIEEISNELQSNSELTRILSVQNQLRTLPAIYEGRPAVDRLPSILDKTTPLGIGLGRLSIDFSTSSIELAGQAPTLEIVNSYVDTLKYTTFKSGQDGQALEAFKDVVLSQFGKDNTAASFTLTFTFDPLLFANTAEIELFIPSTVTTRSSAEPTDLFDGSNSGQEEETENGGE